MCKPLSHRGNDLVMQRRLFGNTCIADTYTVDKALLSTFGKYHGNVVCFQAIQSVHQPMNNFILVGYDDCYAAWWGLLSI